MSVYHNNINVNNKEIRSNIYDFSIIALTSNLAAIDNKINEYEINYIIKLLPNLNKNYILELIDLAISEPQDIKFYINKILYYFPNNYNLYSRILNLLIKLSIIDKPLNIYEENWILEVLPLFKVEYKNFKKLLSNILFYDSIEARKLFDLDKRFNQDELKQTYRKVVKTCHPDNFNYCDNIANSYITIMNEKFIVANEIYNLIQKKGVF